MAKKRVSSKAMNNVVIFAMLFMIALFNLDAFLPATNKPQARPLIAPNEYLLRIEQDNFKLERAGQSWRQIGLSQQPATSAGQQVVAWQQGYLEPVEQKPTTLNTQLAYIVVVWLAGKPNGAVYAFYPDTNATFVLFDDQWFTLEGTTISQLLPWNAP